MQERKGCNLLTKADVQESFWQLHLSCCLPHSALLNPLFLLVTCAFLIDNKNRQAQMSIMGQLFCRTVVLSSSYIIVLLGPDAPSASRERVSPSWPSDGQESLGHAAVMQLPPALTPVLPVLGRAAGRKHISAPRCVVYSLRTPSGSTAGACWKGCHLLPPVSHRRWSGCRAPTTSITASPRRRWRGTPRPAGSARWATPPRRRPRCTTVASSTKT